MPRSRTAAKPATKRPSRSVGRPSTSARPAAVADHGTDDHVDLDDEQLEVEESEGDAETHIDDPVRMYLMQMGEIPMLNRQQEIRAAINIEQARLKFRRTMLCNDFVLHAAANLLEKVERGELRLDRHD